MNKRSESCDQHVVAAPVMKKYIFRSRIKNREENDSEYSLMQTEKHQNAMRSIVHPTYNTVATRTSVQLAKGINSIQYNLKAICIQIGGSSFILEFGKFNLVQQTK